MPKLIIKRNTPKQTTNLIILWSLFAGLLALGALMWWWLKPQTLPVQTLLQGADAQTQTQYQAAQTKLNDLIQSFETQARLANASSPKVYHEQAINQIDTIMEQLNQLDEIVEKASLAPEAMKNLMANHQYQRDYWDAQRHFQTLRIAHFEDEALLADKEEVGTPIVPEVLDVTTPKAQADSVAPTAKSFQFATPPVGAELPADFCVLGSGTCKAQ